MKNKERPVLVSSFNSEPVLIADTHPMKSVHIISLQRTGSKSLEAAITKAIPGSRNLGEILHCWEFHGYKFGPTAEFPFDSRAEVMFRTHPAFETFEGRNFILDTLQYPDQGLKWHTTDYYKIINDIDVGLQLDDVKYINESQPVVLKTQLASLVEDLTSYGLSDKRLDALLERIFTSSDVVVFLTPRNHLQWVISNYLCDTSGVFVPVQAQTEAANQFQNQKVTIPYDYVVKLIKRLQSHQQLIDLYHEIGTGESYGIYTDELKPGLEFNTLRLDIEHPLEFSAFDHRSMISNYDEVAMWVSEFHL